MTQLELGLPSAKWHSTLKSADLAVCHKQAQQHTYQQISMSTSLIQSFIIANHCTSLSTAPDISLLYNHLSVNLPLLSSNQHDKCYNQLHFTKITKT